MKTVIIRERGDMKDRDRDGFLPWRIIWDDGRLQDLPTAGDALAAVQARDQQQVTDGAKIAMTQIEWEPRTRVGAVVVSAIVNQPSRSSH